jgi:hypothetical protein
MFRKRWKRRGSPSKRLPGCDVHLEDRIAVGIREALAKRGHQIVLHGAYSTPMGGGQAVRRDISTGVNYGASDP